MTDTSSRAPYIQQVAHSRRMSVGITAIVMAVFQIGWLGVPKFMLGYQKAGTITLLVTVCTCFAAFPVFNILTLIEGIIYLSKSDEEFYETYMANEKQWL